MILDYFAQKKVVQAIEIGNEAMRNLFSVPNASATFPSQYVLAMFSPNNSSNVV